MIILALAMFDQILLVGFEEDKRAFEPVRQCVLEAARSQYPTGRSLKVIFEKATIACAREDLKASATITLLAMERATKNPDRTERPDFDERRSRLYDELLFEVANDFVPKSK